MANFRAKARAVDLLGKGQIADLPTAISELWKNGLDAYADELEIYLYLEGYKDVKKPLFVLKDDGNGMSREDITEKWLILGTEGKDKINQPPPPPGKEPRVMLGQKGIGRLSVAYLGNVMLMVTKTLNNDLQALLLDWRIFELHNLFLEDIILPVKSVKVIENFRTVFNELREEFLNNFPRKENLFGLELDTTNRDEETQLKLKRDIYQEISQTALPSFFEKEILQPIITQKKGTCFVVFNPIDQIKEISDKKFNTDKGNSGDEIKSNLIGFYNSFNISEKLDQAPPIKTKFEIIDSEGRRDIIDKNDFFSAEDFETGHSDHLIEGHFDEYGQFKGIIRIHKQELQQYSFSTNRPPQQKTPYGAFDIKVGYTQGKGGSSLLEPDAFNKIDAKLVAYGGIYIYRDGFRVLPYGRANADFLQLEEIRNRRLGTGFFSYRRMFGYIGITREKNTGLKDKAGREGFIANIAYRQFKEDLQAFFKHLATIFFGDKAQTDYKKEQEAPIKAQKEQEKQTKENEKKARQRAREESQKFEKEMPLKLDELQQIRLQFDSIKIQLTQTITSSKASHQDIEVLQRQLQSCKKQLLKLLPQEPTTFTLQKKHRKILVNYELTYTQTVEYMVIDENLQTAIQAKYNEHELLQSFDNQYQQYRNSLVDDVSNATQHLKNINLQWKTILDNEKQTVLNDFAKQYQLLKPANVFEVSAQTKALEQFYSAVQIKLNNRLNAFIQHLSRVNLDIDEDLLSLHYKQLAEKASDFVELAQLGIAVEIIDHQYNALYSQMANSFKRLSQYISNNPDAQSEYAVLSHAFEHLEGNYKLLSPLYRTQGRARSNISGKSLFNYVALFFEKDLRNAKIKLESTPAFDKHTVFSYTSIFYAVLVNVVNNAIYWLESSADRRILLDCVEDKMLIMNSGQPIEDYLLENIFELFFTERPNGRGIGLYLARTSLREKGFDIYATNNPVYNRLNGACFIIEPYKP